jgi:hypothetical protein
MERETPATEPLLERDVELELLAELVRGVGAGRGAILLFEAAPGLGKSALLEQGALAARQGGLAVLRARGHELEREFAWGVARSLFEGSAPGCPSVRARQAAGRSGGARACALRRRPRSRRRAEP